MAELDVGQTFYDKEAADIAGQKGKYLIALSSAEYDDDDIICFVMNTENMMHKYTFGCNKRYGKFIIQPNAFSFIVNNTSIMLIKSSRYYMREMYGGNINLHEVAELLLCRQIKNCIDWNYIPPKHETLIKESFKQLK